MRAMVVTVAAVAGCSPAWRAAVEVEALPAPATRVVVVGAGVAGLSAAAALRRAGIEVVVVEARDRIGGRIHTAEVAGVPVDLGAAWIHGVQGSPLAASIEGEGFGLEADTSLADVPVVRRADGSIVSAAALWRALRRWTAAMGAGAREPQDRSTAAALDAWLDARGIDGEERALVELVGLRWSVELEWAAPADDLSVQAAWNTPGFGGGDHLIPGGYGAWVDALAAGVDVRLSEPVRAIAWGDGGVTVRTDRGEHPGSHVIVTVPASVLRAGAIAFDPPLPAARVAALARVGSGALEKVVLRWEDRFWDEPGPWSALDDRTAGDGVCVDLSAHAGGATVVFLDGGATTLGPRTEQDDATLVEAALVRFARGLGRDDVPAPIAWSVTRWATDPWSLGAYSHTPVGTTFDDLEALGEPLGGRVLFAGEHTAGPWHQTVHGALLSGLREAARLGADPWALPGLE